MFENGLIHSTKRAQIRQVKLDEIIPVITTDARRLFPPSCEAMKDISSGVRASPAGRSTNIFSASRIPETPASCPFLR